MNIIKKKIKSVQLNRKQSKINKLMEEDGFTDEVLEMQIELNGLRHELDISDKNNRIHERWVQ